MTKTWSCLMLLWSYRLAEFGPCRPVMETIKHNPVLLCMMWKENIEVLTLMYMLKFCSFLAFRLCPAWTLAASSATWVLVVELPQSPPLLEEELLPVVMHQVSGIVAPWERLVHGTLLWAVLVLCAYFFNLSCWDICDPVVGIIGQEGKVMGGGVECNCLDCLFGKKGQVL